MKKQIAKKLETTKKKVSNNWKKYQDKKQKIQNSRFSSAIKQKRIKELYKKTKSENHKVYTSYRIYKGNKTGKSNFTLINETKIQSGVIKTYHQKNISSLELDNFLNKIVDKSNLRIVIIILTFLNEQTGQKLVFSKSFTPLRLNNNLAMIQAKESDFLSILDLVISELNFSSKSDTTDYKLISIDIKVIYNEKT